MTMRHGAVLLGIALLGSAFSARAATVIIDSPTCDFTVEYDDGSIFGVGGCANNTVFFTPDSFVAQSTNGEGIVNLSETLVLTITARDPQNFSIEELFLVERGDYRLRGNDAEVSVQGQIIARDPTMNPLDQSSAFLSQDTVFIADDALHNWEETAWVQASNDPGAWAGGDVVRLTLENMLSAFTSESGSLAFIEKKLAGIEITVNPHVVPLPAAVWMLGAGLAGLVGFTRRTKN